MSADTDVIRDQLALARDHVAKRAVFLGLGADYADTAIRKASDTCERLWPLLESPIEKIMLPWLLVEDYGPFFLTFPVAGFNSKKDPVAPAGDLVIAPQFAFIRYRCDFALIAKCKGKQKIVTVECDGDQFHTAVKDNRRDACLHTFGIETFRASGKEIHASPRNLTARVSSSIQEWAANQ